MTRDCDDFDSIRMAHAASVNPDLRELKRCNWATSNVRFAPCELPMGHNGKCYNGERDRAMRAAITEAFDLDPTLRERCKP